MAEHDSDTSMIEVLMVEPGQRPKIETIGSDLHSLQEAVGGDIEAAYFFKEPVALICWDEGKLCGAPLNRAIRDDEGNMVDIIAGKFFICGLGEEDFASLPKELQQKFADKFHHPEAFLKTSRGIMAIPIEPQKTTAKSSHQRQEER